MKRIVAVFLGVLQRGRVAGRRPTRFGESGGRGSDRIRTRRLANRVHVNGVARVTPPLVHFAILTYSASAP